MNFICKKSIFKDNLQKLDELIDRRKEFPEQIFKIGFSHFSFLRFDDIFLETFINSIKEFLKENGETEFTFVVVNPNPETYFFEHFRKYSAFEMSVNNSFEEYLSILQLDPGESPADAIVYNSFEIMLFGKNSDWAIYCNRYFEVAILGCKNTAISERFSSIYPKSGLYDLESFISEILPPVFSGSPVPDKMFQSIINNYS